MKNVISIGRLVAFAKNLKDKGKKIVLVGGCFDILHPGHVIFLEKASNAGDYLVVLLESDQRVKELKGATRPMYTQKERAKVLSALRAVDYVVMLPYMKNYTEYDGLVAKIKPDVIAVASKDTNVSHHQRSAKLVGAKLKFVTKMIGNYSSSKILSA